MSLWLDFIGAELRFVDVPGFGRTRIAEAGGADKDALILMHGIGGHLEAYARNVVALSEHYRVIAYDFPGHGQSTRELSSFSPDLLVDHLGALMDLLGLDTAHVSGESLGGWVAGLFATRYPQCVKRLVLNTTGGIPIVSEKGLADLNELRELTKKNAGQPPSMDSVRARMQWLIHPSNWNLLSEELVATRLRYYQDPENARSGPLIGQFLAGDPSPWFIKLGDIACETLFFWTSDNPIHDIPAAEAACAEVPKGQLYVMPGNAAHWPQYENPDDFNRTVHHFLETGALPA